MMVESMFVWVVLWVHYSVVFMLILFLFSLVYVVGKIRNVLLDRQILVNETAVGWLMDIKKGAPLRPNLINLKSNTMKNTIQIYGFSQYHASVLIKNICLSYVSWFKSRVSRLICYRFVDMSWFYGELSRGMCLTVNRRATNG